MTEYPLVGMRAAEPAIRYGQSEERSGVDRNLPESKIGLVYQTRSIRPVHTCARLSRADRVCGTFFALPEKNLLDGALSPRRLRRDRGLRGGYVLSTSPRHLRSSAAGAAWCACAGREYIGLSQAMGSSGHRPGSQ